MKKEEKTPLKAVAAAKYFSAAAKSNVLFKRGLPRSKDYPCRKHYGLTGCFGFEGDRDAPIAFVDGSYLLRDGAKRFIAFGIPEIEGKIKWYNKEGWLPCLVSEFCTRDFEISIESFADRIKIDGNRFSVVYSRMTVKNISGKPRALPRVSFGLIPLNLAAKLSVLGAGKTTVRDYAVPADRFGGKYPFPPASVIEEQGGFDLHYQRMKRYWERRVEPLVQIKRLPDERLINAYKAGYVYTMIVKDGCNLHVGENGYDRVFDHDVIGILVSLLTLGDFKFFKKYTETILMNPQYPDARWKYPWVFALWLMKTGDRAFVDEKFDKIRDNAHSIESDRDSSGVMKKSNAIDSDGYWTIDNQSALTGLAAYAYICEKTGRADEEKWAREQYSSLLEAVSERIARTIEENSLDYLPIAVDEPNEKGPRSDLRDGNWASMFLFGRWSWDGFLLGAEQGGVMLDLIDDTYEHFFNKRAEIGCDRYNFGGYPHGWYSSAYNAGYGSAALRGERFRAAGIKGYCFMLDHTMSAPFSWWEGVDYPSDASPWDIPHAAGGGGSCPHMWGQAVATKVLIDSLIAEKSDGTVLIGRGIPKEWLAEGSVIELDNFPVSGGRIGFCIEINDGVPTLTVSGDTDGRNIILDLPKY